MKILDIPQSGSIAASTSSRNRGGQYRRTRAIPVNPNTAAQQAARGRLSNLSAAWRGLTDAQRAAWIAFGLSFTVVNSLGQAVNLTGSQSYVKVNSVLLLEGDSINNTPPALPSFAALAITGVTATAGTPTLAVAGAAPAAGTRYQLYFSPQLSAGISYNSRFVYQESLTSASSLPYSALTAYIARFGALIAGKKIFLRVVQEQVGMQDSGQTFTAIVGA